MVNDQTKAFFVLMFTCMYKDNWNRDEARLRRLGDIILLKWGIDFGWVEGFIKDNYSQFDGSKMNIDKYAAQVPQKARLRLFILCMDILSAGHPVGEREATLIERMRDALQIEDHDFDRVMWFCSHRSNAVNFLWGKA